MNRREDELRRRLRRTPVPGEAAARERGWRVVAAAFAQREPTSPRRAAIRAVAVAVAAVVAVVTLAVTPPGEAVAEWLRDVVRAGPPARQVRPTLGALPGHGRLLVVSRTGPWIVERDGSRRRLGAYEDATFSPRGLFVAVTRGHLLAAVDPRGAVRWTLSRPAPVTRPSWSPDGFRIAYRSGRELRVVYGDGARDRGLARRSHPVRPAWWPGGGHRVASVDGAGRVALWDADSGRRLWRARARTAVEQLAWSPTGRRLLVVTATAVRVLDPRGGTVRLVRMSRRLQARRVAWLPKGRGFVVLRSDPAGARSEAVLVPREASKRRLLAVPGRLTDLLASPDGRWLLLAAPDAGQWLLVRTSGPGRLSALSDVGRQFDPGGRRAAALPRLVGWIE